MARKGNTIYIVLDQVQLSDVSAKVCEISENGSVKVISTESKLNSESILDLVELIFFKTEGLRSVAITAKSCFNTNDLRSIRPKFVITRLDNGTFRSRFCNNEGDMDIVFTSGARIIYRLYNSITYNVNTHPRVGNSLGGVL